MFYNVLLTIDHCNYLCVCSDIERAQPYLDDIYANDGALLENYDELTLRAEALYDYQAGKNNYSLFRVLFLKGM